MSIERHRPKLKLALIAALSSPLVAAAIAFALSHPPCAVELPAQLPHPNGEHDLAWFRYGPTVVASTADLSSFFHPAFAVDGMTDEPRAAKWVSQKWDRAPWLEVLFRGAHDVERVSLRFAGAQDGRAAPMRDYTIRCLGGTFPPLAIRGNREAAPTHALSCRGATGVRVDFALRGKEVAHLYEIEAVGR